MVKSKVLRKLIRLGSSFAVSMPPNFVSELGEYVWLERQEDGSIRLYKAEVR